MATFMRGIGLTTRSMALTVSSLIKKPTQFTLGISPKTKDTASVKNTTQKIKKYTKDNSSKTKGMETVTCTRKMENTSNATTATAK